MSFPARSKKQEAHNSRPARRPSIRPRRTGSRPRVEHLEDRTLLSPYAYITGPDPFGNMTNDAAMDAAFVHNQWDKFTFITAADPATGVFSQSFNETRKFLFIDGSDPAAQNLQTFLNSQRTSLESFVSAGGTVFVDSASNNGINLDVGFGATLSPKHISNSASAANPLHAIFTDPSLPTGATWTGSSFALDTVSGAAFSPVINGNAGAVLSERDWGGGHVLVGGMSTVNFHNPQPQATNLLISILEYSARTTQRQVAYVVGAGGPNTSDISALQQAFPGFNNQPVPIANAIQSGIFNGSYKLVFVEGGDDHDSSLQNFVNQFRLKLDAYVSAGGSLFVDAAPVMSGYTLNLGFGGATLKGNDTSLSAAAVNPAHDIFNGPVTPVVTSYSGIPFSRGSVSGPAFSTVINNSAAKAVLEESNWGAGEILVGSMTTPDLHLPQPQAVNLLSDILFYGWKSPATEILPGFDLFQTAAVTTYVDLDHLPNLPPNIVLHGRLPLQGVPFDSNLGNTDTIIQRLTGTNFPGGGIPAQVNTELVALYLKSMRPVDLGIGLMADVYVTRNALGLATIPEPLPIPSTMRSLGTLTVRHQKAEGGSLDSTLAVAVDVIFVKPGGNPTVPNDRITTVIYDARPDPLMAPGVQWSHTRIQQSQQSTYSTGDFQVTQDLTPEEAMLVHHGVTPPSIRDIPQFTPPPPQNTNEGQSPAPNFNLGSFSNAANLGPWSVDVDWGDGTGHTTFNVSATGSLGMRPHQYTEEGTAVGHIKVTNNLGRSVRGPLSVIVADQGVVATGRTIQGVENASTGVQTLATFTDPAGTEPSPDYAAPWIMWGDGTMSAGTLSGPVSGVFTVSGSHTYAEEGTYTITPLITHDTAPNVMANSTAVISDPPVVATGGFTFTAVEGTALSNQVVATFTDPAGPEAADGSHYSASIDWGDGTAATAGTISLSGSTFTVSGSHTYAEEGSYSISVTITHESSMAVTVMDTATVSDPAVVGSPVSFSAVEGTALSNQAVATFTDPAGPEAADGSHYSASINWGDGGSSAGTISLSGSTFTVGGSHSYAEEGSYSISVTITHETAPTTTITGGTATVSDAAVVGSPVSFSGVEGAALSNQAVATFTDPGGPEALADYSATIDWGDGSITAGPISLGGSTFTVSGSHTYAEEGTYTIKVTILHDTAPNVTVSSTAAIADAAVVGSPVNFSGVEGAALSNQAVATFTDPGGPEALADYSATIDWGDGSITTGAISLSGSTFTVSGSHTYAEEGPYTVNVMILHDTAPNVTVSSTAVIADPAVVANGGFTYTGVESVDPGPQVVATFTDPGGPEALADYSATIDWGDGSAPATGTITGPDASGVFTVTGHYTYPFQGIYAITVTISHDSAPNVITTSTANIDFLVSYLIVGGFPSPITAGTPGTFTVTAYDIHGKVDTTYVGTITFSSTDSAAVLPPDYTFQPADMGSQSFTAILNTVGTQSIIATDVSNSSVTGEQDNIMVIPSSAPPSPHPGPSSPLPTGPGTSGMVSAVWEVPGIVARTAKRSRSSREQSAPAWAWLAEAPARTRILEEVAERLSLNAVLDDLILARLA